jgi:hypothetical protein
MYGRILALTALASLAAGCANEPGERDASYRSQEVTMIPAQPAQEITKYADANKDGKVTRDEAKADPLLAKGFEKYDLNDDDVLDRGEFARLEDANRRPVASRATTDGYTYTEPSAMPPDMQDVEIDSDPKLNRTGVPRSHSTTTE